MIKYSSSVSKITSFLDGGIPEKRISEWGIPAGQRGRELVLTFLKQASQSQKRVLWVNGHADLTIFPPAWYARGIDPQSIFFTTSDDPMKALKPALLRNYFDMIVFDAGDKQISKIDMAFIRNQLQTTKQTILVLRPHLLSSKQGNPFAHLRININSATQDNRLKLTVLRGLSYRELEIQHTELEELSA